MLDLTKEIKLNPEWQKRYSLLRFFVYFLFLASAVYFSYKVLFPSHPFNFFFETPDATKNTIIDPRDPQDHTLKEGSIKGNSLVFDTAIPDYEGDYSQIKINFTLEKDSPAVKNGNIAIRKSYRAFFYPEGEPIITSLDNSQAPSSRLLSYGESVYITDGKNIYPIDNAITFESMGFDWADVTAASSDEIDAYDKGKLFTIAKPHPDGTIFATKSEGKYYLIDRGKKRELSGQDVINSYLKKTPIIADEKSLETQSSCVLKENRSLFGRSYSCVIPIENLRTLSGNDYQYNINFGEEVKIKGANTTFQKSLRWDNLILTLSTIKKRILNANQPQ
jgi:hypothetical protein